MPAIASNHQRIDYYGATVKTTESWETRRAAIFEGMGERYDEALREHPEIAAATLSDTDEIYFCLNGLALAVNYYIQGKLSMRAEVRPYFDQLIDAYRREAANLQQGLRLILQERLLRIAAHLPNLDLTLTTPEIETATARLDRTADEFLKGRASAQDLHDCFYDQVAVRLEASEPTHELLREEHCPEWLTATSQDRESEREPEAAKELPTTGRAPEAQPATKTTEREDEAVAAAAAREQRQIALLPLTPPPGDDQLSALEI